MDAALQLEAVAHQTALGVDRGDAEVGARAALQVHLDLVETGEQLPRALRDAQLGADGADRDAPLARLQLPVGAIVELTVDAPLDRFCFC